MHARPARVALAGFLGWLAAPVARAQGVPPDAVLFDADNIYVAARVWDCVHLANGVLVKVFTPFQIRSHEPRATSIDTIKLAIATRLEGTTRAMATLLRSILLFCSVNLELPACELTAPQTTSHLPCRTPARAIPQQVYVLIWSTSCRDWEDYLLVV